MLYEVDVQHAYLLSYSMKTISIFEMLSVLSSLLWFQCFLIFSAAFRFFRIHLYFLQSIKMCLIVAWSEHTAQMCSMKCMILSPACPILSMVMLTSSIRFLPRFILFPTWFCIIYRCLTVVPLSQYSCHTLFMCSLIVGFDFCFAQ